MSTTLLDAHSASPGDQHSPSGCPDLSIYSSSEIRGFLRAAEEEADHLRELHSSALTLQRDHIDPAACIARFTALIDRFSKIGRRFLHLLSTYSATLLESLFDDPAEFFTTSMSDPKARSHVCLMGEAAVRAIDEYWNALTQRIVRYTTELLSRNPVDEDSEPLQVLRPPVYMLP